MRTTEIIVRDIDVDGKTMITQVSLSESELFESRLTLLEWAYENCCEQLDRAKKELNEKKTS